MKETFEYQVHVTVDGVKRFRFVYAHSKDEAEREVLEFFEDHDVEIRSVAVTGRRVDYSVPVDSPGKAFEIKW
jgi:hypothetical protein